MNCEAMPSTCHADDVAESDIVNQVLWKFVCRDGGAALQELTEQQQAAQLQCYFLFSLVWSLGANTDAEGRAIFDSHLRKLISKNTPPELASFVTAPEVNCVFGCGARPHGPELLRQLAAYSLLWQQAGVGG